MNFCRRATASLSSSLSFPAVSADGSSITQEKLEKLNIPLIQKPFKMDQVISIINN